VRFCEVESGTELIEAFLHHDQGERIATGVAGVTVPEAVFLVDRAGGSVLVMHRALRQLLPLHGVQVDPIV